MPPDAPATLGWGAFARLTADWRAALIRLGLAWALIFIAFSSDWLAMFGQWWNSSTYNHMLLVPAIFGWLVWQRGSEVIRLAPRCWWPGLVAVAGAALLWMLGAFAGFDLFRQAGAAALLPASALLLLGPKVFTGLLFPFAYLAFLVPFGDELVPSLQMITASLTIAMVAASNIPATVDGVFINTPAGLFEVAEACSGVKFLIAMIALGALVANVGFRSWTRRAAFMALCVVAPVLANGVRAFGTIYAAQYVGAERAGGIDHLIYGWVFFALVIAAVLALSWRFFDRGIDDPMIDPDAITASPWLTRLEKWTAKPALAGAALVAVVAGSMAWAKAADSLTASLPDQIDLPAVPGWHRTDYAPLYPWEPRAAGADHRLLGRYADGAGHQVDVFFALYAKQGEGREAGGFGEGALRPDSGWSWLGAGPQVAGARSERLLSERRTERLAETSYRTGNVLTGSNAALKAATIGDRMQLRARPAMLLILSAEARPGRTPADDLAAFHRSVGQTGAWMDRMASGR